MNIETNKEIIKKGLITGMKMGCTIYILLTVLGVLTMNILILATSVYMGLGTFLFSTTIYIFARIKEGNNVLH